jgi:hypothetical protein
VPIRLQQQSWGYLYPRLAYKWKINDNIRFNTGTGFRIVNLFTEEHAALTGSREVIVLEELNQNVLTMQI